jgi:type IV pilus assembly protein PilE
MATTRGSRHAGFSLIELMVVVLVLAVLAAIAMPRYQMHVVKARRMAAISCLMDQAQVQERWRTRIFSYVGAPAAPCTGELGGYRIEVRGTRAGYQLEAIPLPGSGDMACGVLGLDQAGARSPAEPRCW